VIPNRPVFRAQEVCEIAEVQSYVLRTWEAEFPDLGVAKTPNGPRVYRRADVERVLRIKHLILIDGLTLAGARRQLGEEKAPEAGEAVIDADVAALMDGEVTKQLREVRRGLQWILGVLSDAGVQASPFVEAAAGASGRAGKSPGPAAKAVRASSPAGKASASASKAASRGKKR
jgi:DNA-binding transcriptional MerR regulator